MKNIYRGVLLLVKLQALACNITKSNTPLWVFSTFFKQQKWYQIAQTISYEYIKTEIMRKFYHVLSITTIRDLHKEYERCMKNKIIFSNILYLMFNCTVWRMYSQKYRNIFQDHYHYLLSWNSLSVNFINICRKQFKLKLKSYWYEHIIHIFRA